MSAKASKHKYTILWGKSVYYPHQDKATHRKGFDNKAEAEAFLKKKNKSKSADFTSVLIDGKETW
jgi:hypothetical protein